MNLSEEYLNNPPLSAVVSALPPLLCQLQTAQAMSGSRAGGAGPLSLSLHTWRVPAVQN